MDELFDEYVNQGNEGKLDSWKEKILQIIDKSGIASKDSKPSVQVSYDNIGGSLQIMSMLKDDVISAMGKEVKGMGKDVFLLSCTGTFDFNPKSITVNCSIINEDGVPVEQKNLKLTRAISKRADITRDEILISFDEL